MVLGAEEPVYSYRTVETSKQESSESLSALTCWGHKQNPNHANLDEEMYLVIGSTAVLFAVLYWCYKKFREAPYQPGSVAKAFEASAVGDVMQSNETEEFITLPNAVKLFYFNPSLPSPSLDSLPVVGVHGGPSIAPSEPWKISSCIPNFYLYHARGCGKSTRPHTKFPSPGMWPGMKIIEQDLGIGTQVGDIERIRKQFGSTRGHKIDVVGHSFGGFIATLYAAEFPQHVRSLTLLVPAAVLTLPSSSGDLFSIVKDKLKQKGNPGHVAEFAACMKRYMDFGSLPKETDETLALRQAEFAKHYYRAMPNGTPRKPDVEPGMIGGMACYATFLSMGMEHDYVPALKEMLRNSAFPVSIVHGARDIIPESTSRQYVDLFPEDHVKFHSIAEGDHDLFDLSDVGEIVLKTIERAN